MSSRPDCVPSLNLNKVASTQRRNKRKSEPLSQYIVDDTTSVPGTTAEIGPMTPTHTLPLPSTAGVPPVATEGGDSAPATISDQLDRPANADALIQAAQRDGGSGSTQAQQSESRRAAAMAAARMAARHRAQDSATGGVELSFYEDLSESAALTAIMDTDTGGGAAAAMARPPPRPASDDTEATSRAAGANAAAMVAEEEQLPPGAVLRGRDQFLDAIHSTRAGSEAVDTFDDEASNWDLAANTQSVAGMSTELNSVYSDASNWTLAGASTTAGLRRGNGMTTTRNAFPYRGGTRRSVNSLWSGTGASSVVSGQTSASLRDRMQLPSLAEHHRGGGGSGYQPPPPRSTGTAAGTTDLTMGLGDETTEWNLSPRTRAASMATRDDVSIGSSKRAFRDAAKHT